MEGGPVGRLHPFVFEMLELFLQKEKSIENMKKIVVLLLGLFGWMQIASAQLFDKDTMEEVNSRLGLGMVAGALGIYDSTPCGTVGMNILFKGAYFDFTYFAPRHSEDVRVGQWSDKQSWSIHFGYQIPITEKIRVIPLVGYAQVDLGRTNGWDWHVSKNGIHNKFIPEAKVGGLDFGASLVYSFYWKLIDIKIPMNISLNATRRGIYAGMMFEFYPVW